MREEKRRAPDAYGYRVHADTARYERDSPEACAPSATLDGVRRSRGVRLLQPAEQPRGGEAGAGFSSFIVNPRIASYGLPLLPRTLH